MKKKHINLTMNDRVWNTYQKFCNFGKDSANDKHIYTPSYRIEKFVIEDIEKLRKQFAGKMWRVS